MVFVFKLSVQWNMLRCQFEKVTRMSEEVIAGG
jgi:hypothetical protein